MPKGCLRSLPAGSGMARSQSRQRMSEKQNIQSDIIKMLKGRTEEEK